MRKRIAIDVTPLLNPSGGIGRVTLAMLTELVKLQSEYDLVGFGRRLSGRAIDLPVHMVRARLPRKSEAIMRRLHLVERLCPADLYHATDFYLPLRDPSRAVATVHDLIFLTNPEKMVDHGRLRKWAPDFIRRCRAIIAISEYTKKEIVSVLGVPPERVNVLPLGVDHDLFRPVAHSVERPYFFAISCSTGRKNTPLLLRAYAELARRNPRNDLVLAWDPPPEIRAEFGGHPRIRFLGRQNDEELVRLYSGATAMVFPSLQEGFGLPVLEAMACGAPVITSNTTSLPEAGGDAAMYVDPRDVDSLGAALKAFDDGAVDVAALRARGLSHASRFTWENYARGTLAVYERCLRCTEGPENFSRHSLSDGEGVEDSGPFSHPSSRDRFRRLRAHSFQSLSRMCGLAYRTIRGPLCVIAAHPDDEIFGTGGLLELAQRQDVRSRVLVLTDGGHSHARCCGVSEEEIARKRRELCLRATGSLGLSTQAVRFLGYKDAALPHPGHKDFEALTARLAEEFREFQPATVFAPHPLEGWSDHEAATELTHAALRLSGRHAQLYHYCIWFWYSLSFLKAWRVKWRTARVLDIAPAYDRKRAALDIYLSAKAPCGNPWVGRLPSEFLRAFKWKKELFFESDV